MPFQIIDAIHRNHKRVLLIAIKGVTRQELIEKADEVISIYMTQVGKAIRLCRKKNVKQLILAGRILHKSVFSLSYFRFDWTSLRIWFGLKDKRADSLLKAIAEAFQKKGIEVVDSTLYLTERLAKEGVLTKKQPSGSEWKDIEFGSGLAKGLGRLDIGQTVIVKNLTVVAVEAMEGTDACIERAGNIAGEHCVVVKMAKPNQDMRFDVPVIGRTTLEKLHKIKARVLAVEAEKTLLLDEDLLQLADELGLVIVGIKKA